MPLLMLLIFLGIVAYIMVDFHWVTTYWNSLECLNPSYNYDVWDQYNWAGVILGTLIINIIHFPVAIFYWCNRLLKLGRK